jgi:predicted acyltransferase
MKESSDLSPAPGQLRIESIDLLRAVTMLLMIFVNDLGSLNNIPLWLEHKAPGVDGIGLADVVFPAFLFIVGLSIPFAIDSRLTKGDNSQKIVSHILLRSMALLIMGVFLVNGETFNAAATGMPRYFYNALCCLSFILVWNSYPKTANKYFVLAAKGIGIVTLLLLAYFYRGGEDSNIERFGTQWWGILGLIGWAYLVCSLVTLIAKNNFYFISGAWIFFCLLSILSHADLIPRIFFIPEAILDGTYPGLTMGGVLTAFIFRHFIKRRENVRLALVLTSFAAVLILLSILTRPYWGLAKIGSTPAWLFLCSAFTILALLFFYWLADIQGKAHWFNIVKPAGTATLLCYLIPYFKSFVVRLSGLHLPEVFLTGGIGLLKSFLLAILCALITGWLIKGGVRMRI